MDRTDFIREITKLALNTVIKFTNADLRIHGEENIPAQPSVFVVNHFTRMETFFFPFILNKITGKGALSMAHYSFFGGGFGKYLSKLGAISTHDPRRDEIMIGALLRGDSHCIIFPEGQMVKDKKMVERGKYMIYNTGIRRPPHTGAGILALRAEFYRQKLRSFHDSGYQEGIDSYISNFNLGSRDSIPDIISQETYIVPVNITYYPIRAHKNIINRLAHIFVDKLPERIEEEILVEGTMITEGVDIDINFGDPIPVREYLSGFSLQRKIRDRKLFISINEKRKDLSFRRQGLNLMYRYMDSIYGMTTVNHDHIFSYILKKYSKRIISETDFKNRAYLAIDRIRSVPLQSYHTTLVQKQSYLLTDDTHSRYESFIDAAKSDGLIIVEGGKIYKNRERFTRPYEFHTIRLDNIIEVLQNEIEPLEQVERHLNRIMRTPACMIRRKIRNMYLDLDRDIFSRDYERFYIEGESKPGNIGAPFFLKRWFAGKGVLILHGYMAAPREIRNLAEYLYKQGYTVYGARLRGHGTSPEDLAERRWEEWYESVNRGYIVLKNSVRSIAVAGFSTGAGLALLQAINKPEHFRGVVSINAPLRVRNIASRLASTMVAWNSFLDKLNVQRGKLEFVSNQPENPHINYLRNPVRGVSELEKLMGIIDKRLNELSIPALVIQGSNDPVVNPESGIQIFDKLGTRNKELCRLYAERHGIINGEGAERVCRRVNGFLKETL